MPICLKINPYQTSRWILINLRITTISTTTTNDRYGCNVGYGKFYIITSKDLQQTVTCEQLFPIY